MKRFQNTKGFLLGQWTLRITKFAYLFMAMLQKKWEEFYGFAYPIDDMPKPADE